MAAQVLENFPASLAPAPKHFFEYQYTYAMFWQLILRFSHLLVLFVISEAFQLLLLDSSSLAETYRTLFDRISALGGGEPFAAAMKERRQALSLGAQLHHSKDKNSAEGLVARVVQQILSSGTEHSGDKSLAGVLGGDNSIKELMAEYLGDIPNDKRRRLVQVSSLLQLIIQVITALFGPLVPLPIFLFRKETRFDISIFCTGCRI
jgi:hypothetical protein